jgi:hypothetical protein
VARSSVDRRVRTIFVADYLAHPNSCSRSTKASNSRAVGQRQRRHRLRQRLRADRRRPRKPRSLMLAMQLLQSTLVHINTLLLRQVLVDPDWAERRQTPTFAGSRRWSGSTSTRRTPSTSTRTPGSTSACPCVGPTAVARASLRLRTATQGEVPSRSIRGQCARSPPMSCRCSLIDA